VLNGTSRPPGPLCSILTCRGNSDHAASVHIIAAGRANHGGEGDGWGVIPADAANTYAVGHEIAQTVDQPWPADQLDQVRKAEAAILKKLGAKTSNALCSHSEYAPGRKIDTTEGKYGQNMGSERSTVQAIINGGGTPPPEDDLKHDFVQLSTEVDRDVPTGSTTITFDKEEADAASLHGDGMAGVSIPYNCVATGVIQINGSGKYAIETIRQTGENNDTYQSRSYDQSDGGWSNSPFTTALSKGDSLRVKVTALDAKVPSMVSHVRLFLDLVER
jgi:hypothetical protein